MDTDAPLFPLPDQRSESDPFFERVLAENRKVIRQILELNPDSLSKLPPNLDVPEPPASEMWRHLKAVLERAVVAVRLQDMEEAIPLLHQSVDPLLDRSLWTLGWTKGGLREADLRTSEFTYCAVLALDTVREELGSERAKALEALLVEEALPRYVRGARRGEWWRRADFNWGTALHANAGLAALAIERTAPDLAREVFALVHEGLPYVIESIPIDGGWTEGMMYLTTMFSHLTDFLAAWEQRRGDDLGLTKLPAIHHLLDFRMHMFGGDGQLLNFSNCMACTDQYYMPHVYWWASRCNRPEWAWFETQHRKAATTLGGLFHEVETFWFRETGQPEKEPKLPKGRHFRELDWFVWHGDKTWLAFRSGFNGGNHNNRDLGHFILGRGRDRFLADPGYGAGRADQHNTFTLRNMDQDLDARARIFRRRQWRDGFYLCCDLTNVASNRVAYAYRHLLLLEDRHLLVVDDILGRAGHRPSARWYLQTLLPVSIADDRLLIEGEESTLRMTPLAGVNEWDQTEWEWRGVTYTRISWNEEVDRERTLFPCLYSFDQDPGVAVYRDNQLLKVEAGNDLYQIDLAVGTVHLPEHLQLSYRYDV